MPLTITLEQGIETKTLNLDNGILQKFVIGYFKRNPPADGQTQLDKFAECLVKHMVEHYRSGMFAIATEAEVTNEITDEDIIVT